MCAGGWSHEYMCRSEPQMVEALRATTTWPPDGIGSGASRTSARWSPKNTARIPESQKVDTTLSAASAPSETSY